jgi:6-pyruvoyltetrahydropterin/6-carboxytetrahydropterin synthase
MHGHNYAVTVFLVARELDADEWVMDYAQMDVVVKPIINELDHRYIVSRENDLMGCPYAPIALQRGDAVKMDIQRSTAESIAKWLADEIRRSLELIGYNDLHVKVDVGESPKSTALYS